MTIVNGDWGTSPQKLNLADNDVHIWCTDLDQPLGLVRQLADTLSPDEKIRARRFHFEHDRRHFMVG